MQDKSSKENGPKQVEMFATSGKQEPTTLNPSMCSPQDSPVRALVWQGKAGVSKTRDRASGLKLFESFARYDHQSSCWRTCPQSEHEDSELYSGAWPASGTMRSGVCSPLPMSVPHIKEDVGGASPIYPTPSASPSGTSNNGKRPDGTTYRTAGRPSLRHMARHGLWPTPTSIGLDGGGRSRKRLEKLWPTPRACEGASPSGGKDPAKHGLQRRVWSTPTVQDSKNNGSASQLRRNSEPLNAQARGPLNPEWVEHLMGFRAGHTRVKGYPRVGSVVSREQCSPERFLIVYQDSNALVTQWFRCGLFGLESRLERW